MRRRVLEPRYCNLKDIDIAISRAEILQFGVSILSHECSNFVAKKLELKKIKSEVKNSEKIV